MSHRVPEPVPAPERDGVFRYAKALVAALVAGLTALGTAMVDDRVTGGEWVAVAIAALGALGAVWAVPNAAVRRTGG